MRKVVYFKWVNCMVFALYLNKSVTKGEEGKKAGEGSTRQACTCDFILCLSPRLLLLFSDLHAFADTESCLFWVWILSPFYSFTHYLWWHKRPLSGSLVSSPGSSWSVREGRSGPSLMVLVLQPPDPGKSPHYLHPQVWSDNVFFLKREWWGAPIISAFCPFLTVCLQ